MTIPHVPFNMAGMRPTPIAPPPEPREQSTAKCANCTLMVRLKDQAIDQKKELATEVAALKETVTELRALVNAKPPTDREFADVHARMHTLAQQEAAARRANDAIEKDLAAVTADRDRALRMIDNLHRRIERLGFTV